MSTSPHSKIGVVLRGATEVAHWGESRGVVLWLASMWVQVGRGGLAS